MMKKLALVMLLLVNCSVILSGCGSKYVGTTWTQYNEEVEWDKIPKYNEKGMRIGLAPVEYETVTLEKDDYAIFTINSQEYPAVWEETDNGFSVFVEDNEYDFIVEDNEATLQTIASEKYDAYRYTYFYKEAE